MYPEYLCPLCQQPLMLVDKSFCCTNRHSFDQAKEGYVNLLPVQFKHSKSPGDNKAMVQARRAFLQRGFYQPLADRITALYLQYADAQGNVLDAGCGEGYYSHQHKTGENRVYGVDISKEAIKIAAKKYPACAFSVATLSQLPFANGYFNWITSIYAPILEQEFSRVLAPQGYLLTVTPAEQHLFELKSMIYQQAQQHDVERQPITGMALRHEETLNYPMTFNNNQDLLNLLAMTPFAFKTSQAQLAELQQQQQFSCQADFLIRLYQLK